jgi:hypothetical protein
MKILNDTKLNTILFGEDLVIFANSEDNLRRDFHTLHQKIQIFDMKGSR